MNFLKSAGVCVVSTRPVKATAMQFLYQEGTDKTLHHVRSIEACLDVRINCGNDQGAFFCHLELDPIHDVILSNGDWVVRDVFGKVSRLSDKEFHVYYEPGD